MPDPTDSVKVWACPERHAMLYKKVPTPCVGICSTTFGDTVCRGCKRYLHEVINWNRYTDEQKRLIWARLDALPAQVLPQHFSIEDADKLARSLKAYRIPHRPGSNQWTQLLALLKAVARQEPDLATFGVTRLNSTTTLVSLRDELQQDIYLLAQASYDKDFLRAARQAAYQMATPSELTEE